MVQWVERVEVVEVVVVRIWWVGSRSGKLFSFP